MSRLQRTLAAIDAANADDPNLENVDGEDVPKELIYGQRMSAVLASFAPDASEALQIAARAQHIMRWKSPRSGYPMDRKGYLQWRHELYGLHAEWTGEIMRAEGWDEPTIARVGTLLRKKGLKTDAEVQTLEDVICLVFLQHYFVDFASQHPDAKVIDIVQKTWAKMSEAGHAAALALELPSEASSLVQRALLTPRDSNTP